MTNFTFEERFDDRRAAKVEADRYGCHLLTMNNGYQWSGAAIYSIEVAEAAISVLQKYVNAVKQEQDDE